MPFVAFTNEGIEDRIATLDETPKDADDITGLVVRTRRAQRSCRLRKCVGRKLSPYERRTVRANVSGVTLHGYLRRRPSP